MIVNDFESNPWWNFWISWNDAMIFYWMIESSLPVLINKFPIQREKGERGAALYQLI